MSERLTAEQIAELRAKWEAGTKGEWIGPRVTDMWPPGWIGIYAMDGHVLVDIVGVTGHMNDAADPRPDAASIVALYNAAPSLLAMAERALRMEAALKVIGEPMVDPANPDMEAQERINLARAALKEQP